MAQPFFRRERARGGLPSVLAASAVWAWPALARAETGPDGGLTDAMLRTLLILYPFMPS
jgi:hypothetical protein